MVEGERRRGSEGGIEVADLCRQINGVVGGGEESKDDDLLAKAAYRAQGSSRDTPTCYYQRPN